MEALEKYSTQLSVFTDAKEKIAQLSVSCKNYVISDEKSLNAAEQLAKDARKIESMIEERRKEITKPILDEKKMIDDFAKELTSELNQSINDLRGQILKFKQELERIRQAELKKIEEARLQREFELRKIEEERIAKEKELLAQMEKNQHLSTEAIEELETLRNEAAQIKNAIAEPVAPVTQTQTGVKKVWTYEIENGGLIPREYLVLNSAAIKLAIADGVREIPGIKIFQKEQLNLR